MSSISNSFWGVRKVLLHTYVVAGRGLLRNTVVALLKELSMDFGRQGMSAREM